MLLVRICWGPARGRFAGSGGFGFRILDFEFVWDFDIGISDFPFWLRPQAALGISQRILELPGALITLPTNTLTHARRYWLTTMPFTPVPPFGRKSRQFRSTVSWKRTNFSRPKGLCMGLSASDWSPSMARIWNRGPARPGST